MYKNIFAKSVLLSCSLLILSNNVMAGCDACGPYRINIPETSSNTVKNFVNILNDKGYSPFPVWNFNNENDQLNFQIDLTPEPVFNVFGITLYNKLNFSVRGVYKHTLDSNEASAKVCLNGYAFQQNGGQWLGTPQSESTPITQKNCESKIDFEFLMAEAISKSKFIP